MEILRPFYAFRLTMVLFKYSFIIRLEKYLLRAYAKGVTCSRKES